MDGPQLTDQQQNAISRRGVSIALSAGAGCGKTFVLTERFLSYLQPGGGVSLSELVAITFTERAAREMRDRVRRRCQERLQETKDSAEADHWLRVAREVESARISTIHAFCAALLRAHAVEAGLDPQFRVLEQTQAETLLAEVIDDALRLLLAQQHPAVMDLIVVYGLGPLKGMLRAMLEQRDKIDFATWRTRTPEDVLDLWADYHGSMVVPEVLRETAQGEPAVRVLRALRDNVPTNPAMQRRRTVLLDRLPLLPESRDPRADLELLKEQARVQGGGGKGAWCDEQVYNEFLDAAADLRKRIDKALRLIDFAREPARPAALAGMQLLEVTEHVLGAFNARKRELGVLDFDDLLIRTRDLLHDRRQAALRQHVARQIHALLVDEFQDTDPLQVELVKALCGEDLPRGKLFFVGDYKQSIYRFRRADPRVFRQLQQEVPAKGRLPLTLNFRSQPQVLAFVNALFCDELGPEYEPLQAHRPQVTPAPSVEFLWAPAENPDEADAPSLRRREAQWIAQRLRGMLDSEATIVAGSLRDPKSRSQSDRSTQLRRVQPGDIAILFRALSDVQYYEEALRNCGIDYYLVGGHAFYAQQEIFDLLNLLRTLAYPGDPVSLAGVLRSPFFSLADETLFWLSKHSDGLAGGLFAGSLPKHLDTDRRRRVEFAATMLHHLRDRKDRVPIAALIEEAMQLTGYDAVLLAEFMGERKLANLRKLIQQARGFDRSGMFTLADFITQLAEFVARQPDEPLAATMPESTCVVRLMTIHQAKGLEFPVVVVPDLQRAMNSFPPSAAFHPDLGPLVRPPETPRRERDVVGYEFLKRMEAAEDEAELARLFYVATTRAADYLILSSGVTHLGQASSPWMKLLAKRFDLETGEFRGTLPAGYERPAVLVTTTEPQCESGRQRARRIDLKKIVAEATDLAAKGKRPQPATIAPLPADASARREFSFSRLSGTLHESSASHDAAEAEEDRERTPAIDPLGLGTLIHAVMEELPFAELERVTLADIEQLVRRHAVEHLPNNLDGQQAAVEMVHRFLQSPQAAELAAAEEVHRELEFLLAWPPADAKPGGIYLRGYIDCLYQDASGAWRVLDYKTNVTTKSTIQDVAARYEMQMLVYGLAAETALNQQVESLTLYFLRAGVASTFQFDKAARRCVVTLVNQSIDRYLRQSQDGIIGTPSDERGSRSAKLRSVPPSHFGKPRQPLLPGFSQEGTE